jgi:hydrogenase maturation protease
MTARVLVAGIGNIFFGDDGFGVEVVRRLAQRPLPEGVKVVDFGIRALDLTYALLDGYDMAILVDATSRGRAPGTLYLIEPEIGDGTGPALPAFETHGMDAVKVLERARAMGGALPTLRVLGCEPSVLGNLETGEMGLSAAVEAAVEDAVAVVERLVAHAQGAGHA